ncbi:MAG: cytochrome b/b6 domain-containing protein [Myxococcota bacterium]
MLPDVANEGVAESLTTSSPRWLRRALHSTNLIASLALIATGLLITFPDARAQLVGGYALLLTRLHHWAALVFVAAPLLALAAAPLALGREFGGRLLSAEKGGLRRAHLATCTLASIALALSGALLWAELELPRAFEDAMVEAHVVATWVVVVGIPVHLVAVRRRLRDATAELLRRAPADD